MRGRRQAASTQRPVTPAVVQLYPGDEHCGQQDEVFLHVGMPIGTEAKIAGADAREYAKAAGGDAVDLPASARPTGLVSEDPRSDTLELWLDDADPDVVFLVTDDGPEAERWVPEPLAGTCD